MKICCMLPSATEIAYAVGLGPEVAAVTYGCDYPPDARNKTVVVRSKLSKNLKPAVIDRQVREFIQRGENLYQIDEEALRRIQPDLILTQELCKICATSPEDLSGVLESLQNPPQVLSLHPHTLGDVWNNIREVGQATGHGPEAENLACALETRVGEVHQKVKGLAAPRVVCLEWLDPLFVAGHWVPEMVAVAGGRDVLGRVAEPSFRTDWGAVIASRPDIIVLMPCGYSLEETVAEYNTIPLPPGWDDVPAVRQNRIYAVDATNYYSRPGPRLAEGVEALAGMLHPDAGPPQWIEGRGVRCSSRGGSGLHRRDR